MLYVVYFSLFVTSDLCLMCEDSVGGEPGLAWPVSSGLRLWRPSLDHQ